MAGGGAAALAQVPEEAVYQSATVCAQCHPEIYKTWFGSLHARSFTDPAFQLPYDRIRRADPRRSLPCERCHNPMRFLLAAGDPRSSIFGQEGVTCDFCHSVESAATGGEFPRYMARPGIKFGPQGGRSGKSPHATRFSRLHITSTLCAGCHEFRNEHGIPVLSTTPASSTRPARRDPWTTRWSAAIHGTVLGKKEEVFERVLGDGTGKPLAHPEMVFTEAREVLEDNRRR